MNDEGKATSVDDFTLRQWDVKTLQPTVTVEGGELDKFGAGCHVPFKPNQFITACNQGVKIFDMASKKCVLEEEGSSLQLIETTSSIVRLTLTCFLSKLATLLGNVIENSSPS